MTSDWIVNAIERGGYLAVALLMLGENVFPPIPSEIVLIGLAALYVWRLVTFKRRA